MKIIIATVNCYKKQELSKYFHNIGLQTHNINKYDDSLKDVFPEHICVREQTSLISKETGEVSSLLKFEEVIHKSVVSLDICKNNETTHIKFHAEVEGFIFPTLKTNRSDIYDWDDIFVSASTMKTYQEMKDNGIKNSARDLAFAQIIDYLPEIFKFDEKINLKFNPVAHNETISFEPIIKNLFDNNKYYQVAYKNTFFKKILNNVMQDGLFVRRAGNRKQKNYWLPGLNAGIPLTPKKDELHELTFMFHDIMHFIFPDLIVLENNTESKNKYIISRMMSEAFTLVLADMLFISLLKKDNVEYDYAKRKIYPLFESLNFDISEDNLPLIKELLWANVCFAVLGQDAPLKLLVNNDIAFEAYKSKYQKFFQEDYIWTNNNFQSIAKQQVYNQRWHMLLLQNNIAIPNTETFCPNFNINQTLEEQAKEIFDCMFSKIENMMIDKEEYDPNIAFTNAIKKYMAGQIYIFFKFETLYNKLFLNEILKIMNKAMISKEDLNNILSLYHAYINKLGKDNFISPYEVENFKNIYPIFEPFYVFYDKEKAQNFQNVLDTIFKKD